MEFYPDGDLAKHVNENHPLRDSDAQGICRQILMGLDFMHGNSIAHRDLKPQVGLQIEFD
jgi:serine/threonine protein kinase